jgi:hypothetical protein
MMLKLREEAEVRCEGGNYTNASMECRPLERPCLFNLKSDPCERVNLASINPTILEKLERQLKRYRRSAVKPGNIPGEPEANPEFWNNTWSCWHDEIERRNSFFYSEYFTPLIAGICLIVIIVLLIFLTPRHIFLNQVVPETTKTMSVFTLEGASQEERKRQLTQ